MAEVDFVRWACGGLLPGLAMSGVLGCVVALDGGAAVAEHAVGADGGDGDSRPEVLAATGRPEVPDAAVFFPLHLDSHI